MLSKRGFVGSPGMFLHQRMFLSRIHPERDHNDSHERIRNDFCARKMNLEPVGPGNDNNDKRRRMKITKMK